MIKRKHFYLPLIIGLVLILSLVGGCGKLVSDKYNLTTSVSPTGGGSVSPSGGSYDPGVTVTISATANSGYVFDYWSGSTSGTNATTTVVMDAHKSVTAHFVPVVQTYTLTTSVNPAGAGSVSPSGGEYDAGTQVSVSANANSGYIFDYWSGSISGTGPNTSVTMDSDKEVIANFATAGPAVLFSDDFSHDTGDWDVFSDENGEVFYEGGWLHVINYTTAPICTYTLVNQYFTDFILEIDTKLVDGTDDNWHQIEVRVQNVDNYYNFGISADGYYELFKVVNGSMTSLVSPTYSSYINQGWDVVNTVQIECIGSSLNMSVNGHTLISVTDTSFNDGDIGFAASSWAGSFSEIAWDNLLITEP